MQKISICTLVITFCILSCGQSDPNVDQDTGTNELEALVLETPVAGSEMKFNDVIYVPIYSDIYVDATTQKCLLAATLSIRNTSETDSIFISQINYFDTDGNLVRKYLDDQISLRPMATINYVIEREDEVGGSGANFIVRLSSKSPKVKPIIQAIMIGQSGNKGFSFSTEGRSIK